jgi:hypothetical protein
MLTLSRDRRVAAGGRGIPISSISMIFPNVNAPEAATKVSMTADGIGNARDEWQAGERQIVSRLRLIRDEQATRMVSGSQRIQVRDLFGNESVLVPFRAVGLRQEDSDPLRVVLDRADAIGNGQPAPNNRRLRILVTGSPGMGKSTFATATFQELTARLTAAGNGPVPILLDLRDYREQGPNTEFATAAWTQSRLDEIAGVRGALRADDDTTRLYPVIILDSLDEYFAGKSAATTAEITSRFLFRRANVVCCRTFFYEQNLAMLPIAAQFDRFNILPWTSQDIYAYIAHYYRKLFPRDHQHLAEQFIGRLRSSNNLAAMCSVPLRLNMALDLLRPGRDELNKATTLLGLYHTYVELLLANEAGKGGSVLSGPEKASYLELIAWHFYDEGNLGDVQAPPFTRHEFENFLGKEERKHSRFTTEQIESDLRARSLLQEDGSIFSAIDPGTLSFEHKSFQEYLVARHIFHAMTSEDVAKVAEMFCRQVSAEVSEFLKEYIERCSGSSRMITKIARNLNAAYQVNVEMSHTEVVEEAAKARVGKAQIGYYLGSLRVPLVVRLLREIYQRETDHWIRRGIAIGLSIGGEESLVHPYIEGLRAERSSGVDPVENAVNIGFHLSFFGDQPFDSLQPDVDQRGVDCSRTIRRLIYQLDTETDRGSWRMNLYTIADLWRYRIASRQSCGEVISQHATTLRQIIARLKEDPWSAWWPELDEVGGVIEKAEAEQNL